MPRTIWITLMGALLLPAAAFGRAPTADQLQELYVRSGIEMLVAQIPAGIQAGFTQSLGHDRRLSRRQLQAIRSRIPRAYAPDAMRPIIVEALKTGLTAEELPALLAWLNSPLGRKCTDLESAASSPEAFEAMQSYAGELQQSPPPPSRAALLGELATAVKAAENAIEVVMSTQFAVAAGMMAALPAEQQQPLAFIRDHVEQFRPQVTAAMQSQTMIAFLYTYRGLSEDEIEHYLQFATSTVGRRYHAAASEGIKQALTASSLKLGAMITDILRNMANQTEI